MGGAGPILLLVLMLGVVAVLITGIGLMAKGGEASKKHSNKLMVMRVALQGLAVVVVALLLMTKK